MRLTTLKAILFGSMTIVAGGFYRLNQGQDQDGLILMMFGLICTLLCLLAGDEAPAPRVKPAQTATAEAKR